MTKQTKQEKLEALINSKLKEYEAQQAKDKKRAKKAKRNGRRAPVPKGDTDYKWCDYPTCPTLDIGTHNGNKVDNIDSNGIRVR